MIVISALVFLCVVLAAAAAVAYYTPTRTQRRLSGFAPAAPDSTWTETFVRVAGPFARLAAPRGDWANSPLRQRFLNAGFRRDDARMLYFGAKAALPLLFAGLTFVLLRTFGTASGLTLLLVVLVSALFGCYLPNLVVHFKRKERQREIFETFPDAADLMLVCVEAGLGLDAGLVKVAEEIRRKSVALAEELHLTNLEMRAGGTREQALRNLALRTGIEEIGTFATMLTQADKFGTSVADSLRVFSDDLRYKRQVAAEERAAKIPTKMLVPLVLFIFPSVIMVVLGPALITIIRTVLPMLTRGR
ncbi:type II secretion system F family protein [Ramlibacter algicola]|uniref:Type II secretion system F family protein n=1 Tax=Ramlibacter algicola TaxID=2795217 RepID=A0A934URQ9_9BURK|nr:type II secretion system F family protein [Ramlibacter algicola]MBK0394014.1 type II secretion system F family protein [Ramlibacter algicola]